MKFNGNPVIEQRSHIKEPKLCKKNIESKMDQRFKTRLRKSLIKKNSMLNSECDQKYDDQNQTYTMGFNVPELPLFSKFPGLKPDNDLLIPISSKNKIKKLKYSFNRFNDRSSNINSDSILQRSKNIMVRRKGKEYKEKNHFIDSSLIKKQIASELKTKILFAVRNKLDQVNFLSFADSDIKINIEVNLNIEKKLSKKSDSENEKNVPDDLKKFKKMNEICFRMRAIGEELQHRLFLKNRLQHEANNLKLKMPKFNLRKSNSLMCPQINNEEGINCIKSFRMRDMTYPLVYKGKNYFKDYLDSGFGIKKEGFIRKLPNERFDLNNMFISNNGVNDSETNINKFGKLGFKRVKLSESKTD